MGQYTIVALFADQADQLCGTSELMALVQDFPAMAMAVALGVNICVSYILAEQQLQIPKLEAIN